MADMVNRTDDETRAVPSGGLGDSVRLDQRLVKVKDRQQRLQDAQTVLKKLSNRTDMLMYSMIHSKQCECLSNGLHVFVDFWLFLNILYRDVMKLKIVI